jgi:hypothetical protein
MSKRLKTVQEQFKHMVEQLIITHDNFMSGKVITSSKQAELLALPVLKVRTASWYNVDNYIDTLLQDIYTIEPEANSSLVLNIFSKKFYVQTSSTKSFKPWDRS